MKHLYIAFSAEQYDWFSKASNAVASKGFLQLCLDEFQFNEYHGGKNQPNTILDSCRSVLLYLYFNTGDHNGSKNVY